MKTVSNEKLIFLIAGSITLMALIVLVAFSLNQDQQRTNSPTMSYSSSDKEKPTVNTTSTSSDLGQMKLSEEKKADFSIENTGTRPLQLFHISSSCDCTFGQVTIDGNKSPQFSMHADSNWVGNINPGQKATLSVIYRPSIMPVKGDVTREVFVQTNDPQNKELTFTVKAFVE